jgi:hypothetical protein
MVGETGFEPATPTSRRLRQDVSIRRGEYRHEGRIRHIGRLSHGMRVVRWSQRTEIYMAGYGCFYGGGRCERRPGLVGRDRTVSYSTVRTTPTR